MLKIYNSISREKQDFIPINKNLVNIYVCGVTVYDYCHLGHARTYIFFDLVTRYLKYLGYEINLIRNITDIDDKILNRAQQQGATAKEIADQFTFEMHQDFAALNLLTPTVEPKATEYINAMINLIVKLLKDDYAYIGDNGDIFYNINKFKNYGDLAKRDFNNLQHTARVTEAVQVAKQNSQDFVLWKLVPEQQVGWDSPWGYGRPGWHTECAAMSLKLFDGTFDLHGGGCDLMFPHHENEIAQAEAFNGKKFVNYWMHVGFLQINQQKMSKSLGNFTTIREALTTIHPEVLRLFMLSSHYRSQIEFEPANLLIAKNSLARLYLALRGVVRIKSHSNVDKFKDYLQNYTHSFESAMNDDFNTPLALSVLFELSKELNILKEQAVKFEKSLEKYLFQDLARFSENLSLKQNVIFDQELLLLKISLIADLLIKLGNTLGLLHLDPEEFFTGNLYRNNKISEDLSVARIEELILQRNQARQAKNWQAADLIRQQLLDQGIILEDRGEDTIWRVDRN